MNCSNCFYYRNNLCYYPRNGKDSKPTAIFEKFCCDHFELDEKKNQFFDNNQHHTQDSGDPNGE